MTTCAIMQPTYLPWIGYFALIDLVDVFVFLDDVQLVKQSWQTRNRIKRQDGEELILSVPISRALGIQERMIKDVEISDGTPWVTKHLRSFEQYYRKAPHFAEAMALYEPVLRGHGSKLCDLSIALIEAIATGIGIRANRRLRSSEIAEKSTARSHRLVDICHHVGAHVYLSPAGSAEYLIEADGAAQFKEHHINLLYRSYQHPVYPQLHGPFRSHLCILDLLANVGVANAAAVIRSGIRASVRTPAELSSDTLSQEAV
jgi:hypothetical protein